jgi:hypothetical protein
VTTCSVSIRFRREVATCNLQTAMHKLADHIPYGEVQLTIGYQDYVKSLRQ